MEQINDQDRIRLAEARGWLWHQPTDNRKKLFDNGMGRWEFKGMFRDWSTKEELPFDPENDANDDYAVLEWMRKQKSDLGVQDFAFTWTKFSKLLGHHCWYKIGDYARAALTVLDKQKI